MAVRTVTILSVAGVAAAACVAAVINVQVLSAATQAGRASSQSLQNAGALSDPAIRVVAPVAVDEQVLTVDDGDAAANFVDNFQPFVPTPAPDTTTQSIAGAAVVAPVAQPLNQPVPGVKGAGEPTRSEPKSKFDVKPVPTPSDLDVKPVPTPSDDVEPIGTPDATPVPDEVPKDKPELVVTPEPEPPVVEDVEEIVVPDENPSDVVVPDENPSADVPSNEPTGDPGAVESSPGGE